MSLKVLLCDDDLHILRAAEFKLKRSGYEVICAGDGEEGWQRVCAERPDILVTDCQMPRLDGLALIERIRNTPETAALPAVMLTAKGYELPREELAARWRVAAVLAKPFSPRELAACVTEVLRTGQYVSAAPAVGQAAVLQRPPIEYSAEATAAGDHHPLP